ncbi:MAG: IS5 family transposase [Chitinophagaceae bacterium]|nr:MAG: IS5 family transposase [Chitinophagaceae bacterium]
MKKTEYCSSLTEVALEQIKPCLSVKRRSKWDLLTIVNAILYVCDGGIKWRDVPHDFAVPWQTVYWYFQKWTKEGVWQAVNDQVVMLRRIDKGSAASPSFAVVDSQTVHNTSTAGGEVGYDGGKKIKGRKRLLMVDTQGHLLSVRVVSAACHDGTAALQWWKQEGKKTPLLTGVERIYGDKHFGGRFKDGVEKKTTIKVITSHEQIGVTKDGMKLHKRRWVVERTFAWELCSRRLTRDFERNQNTPKPSATSPPSAVS